MLLSFFGFERVLRAFEVDGSCIWREKKLFVKINRRDIKEKRYIRQFSRKGGDKRMDWNKEEKEKMLASAFPFWEKLTKDQQNRMLQGVIGNHYVKGTMLHYGGKECAGVQIIYSGQARVFVTSAGGGEITLFRLLDGDVSILSAACMMRGMDIELDMELETDSEICTIPKCIYQKISEENAEVKDYTLEMISEKFSDIMWLFNQYVFSNVASRLAGSILEHRALAGTDLFSITHDVLARDIGTAREVVTRLLKQFQKDGLIKITRGKIEVLDSGKLSKI